MSTLIALLVQTTHWDLTCLRFQEMPVERIVLGSGIDLPSAEVRWKAGPSWQRQVLATKPTWSFINRKERQTLRFNRTTFGIVKGSTTPILWTLNTIPSGVYEYAAVRFLALSNGRWKWVPVKGRSADFSGRGTFWIEGSRLYICDYELDNQGGHYSPMPYRFTQFSISQNEVRERSSRLTKGRFSPESPEGTIPETVRPKNDPMREFGRTWKRWGPRQNGGR